MSLLLQEPQHTVGEQSQENSEDEQIWQEIAGQNIAVLDDVIKEIVENEDQLPDQQLFEAAKIVSEISSGIESLRDHEDDFKRLLGDASGLVVVLWQSYKKSNFTSLWPPPKFAPFIDELAVTVYRIHQLMKRKNKKNVVKRTLVGCFGLRNLGKFKKYQRRLDSVALFLESKPNRINISKALLEVIESRPQPLDQDTELSEEAAEGDSPINQGTKQNAATQEPTAEGSRLRKADKPTVTKSAKQQATPEEVEDDERGYKASGKQKAKDRAKDDVEGDEGDEGHSAKAKRSKKKTANADKGKRTRYKDQDEEDLEQDDFGQGSRANNTTQSKSGKRLSDVEDDEDTNADVPVRDPVRAKVPAKKKAAAKPKARSQSIPLSPPPSSISGFAFNNHGPGTMNNENVGNIYNSSISGVGNDYSVNHFRPRRKRTYA